jgi:putative MFS transporter
MPAVWLAVPLSAVIWLYPRAGGAAGQAVLLFLVGFWRNPVWAIVAAYLPVMFPTRLRGTGMGITWVAGWLLGYTLSALWGTQLHAAGWGPWWIVQLILLALMPLVMIFAGVETQGRRLDFQEEDPADARTSATAGR